LYAEHLFGWDAEQLSYYITFVGGVRALHLLFALPFIILFFKPKFPIAMVNGKKGKPTKEQLAQEMKFDLRLSRLSYAIDLLSHVLVSFSSTAATTAAQVAFVGFTVLSCFGSGVVPSVQSLALCILQADAANEDRVVETGPLFGAFAVLQATGQMILGPMLYGLVYSSTVAKFPKAIFVLAASAVFVSLLLLSFVHHGSGQLSRSSLAKSKRRQEWDDEIERGRSRVSKDISGASSFTAPSGSGSSDSNSHRQ